MSMLVPIPLDGETTPERVVSMKRNINSLSAGHINAIGTVTLTNGGTTTTLTDNHINPNCVILFSPQTAHAAAITGLYPDYTSIPTTGPFVGGQITLHHSSSANSDLTFGYVIFT